MILFCDHGNQGNQVSPQPLRKGSWGKILKVLTPICAQFYRGKKKLLGWNPWVTAGVYFGNGVLFSLLNFLFTIFFFLILLPCSPESRSQSVIQNYFYFILRPFRSESCSKFVSNHYFFLFSSLLNNTLQHSWLYS